MKINLFNYTNFSTIKIIYFKNKIMLLSLHMWLWYVKWEETSNDGRLSVKQKRKKIKHENISVQFHIEISEV